MTGTEAEILLGKRGVRPTPNRILVMRELMRATHPISLADLETAMGYRMDKASIFRVLELFAEKDVVHAIEDGSRSLKYELCHSESCHTIADQHVHFYCERCRRTYCMEGVGIPVVAVPEGFRPRSVNYMIKGLCPKCAGKSVDNRHTNP